MIAIRSRLATLASLADQATYYVNLACLELDLADADLNHLVAEEDEFLALLADDTHRDTLSPVIERVFMRALVDDSATGPARRAFWAPVVRSTEALAHLAPHAA